MEKLNYITKKMLKTSNLGCPFCGSVDNLWIAPNDRGYRELVDQHGSAMISIECDRCAMALKQFGERGESYNDVLSKLWDRWCVRGGGDQDE